MFEVFTDLATWLVVDVFGLSKATKLGDALHFFIEDTTKIFFLLPGQTLLDPSASKWFEVKDHKF